uniref:Death ligand signal enhancer n=1 Tax=Macrostomum lignano TaxID=282301 RepID=A0A1I8F9I3_9PLAT
MHAARAAGGAGSCQNPPRAVQNVAERGRWSDQLMEAHRLYKEESGSAYAMAACFSAICFWPTPAMRSRGVLRSQRVLFSGPPAVVPAAAQSYAQARLKLADYHYYGPWRPGQPGAGRLSLPGRLRPARATRRPCSTWPICSERGLGLERDLHLAKRYYDQAAEASADAYMPVMLALCRLAWSLLWTICGAATTRWRTSSPCCPSQTSGHPPPCRRPSSSGPDSIRLGRLLMMKMENPPDSANQQRQYSMAAGSRSWDSLLLTVLCWHVRLPAHSIPQSGGQ